LETTEGGEVDLLAALIGAGGLGGARQGESEGVVCLDCCSTNSVERGLSFFIFVVEPLDTK
jgi:hypothetical protein